MPQNQRAAGSPFPALLAKLGSPGTHFSPTIAFFKTCVFRGKFQKGDGLGRILGYLGKPTCTQTFPNQFQPVWPRTTNTNEKAMRECLGNFGNFGKLWDTNEKNTNGNSPLSYKGIEPVLKSAFSGLKSAHIRSI